MINVFASFRNRHTVHNFVENNHKLWTFLFQNLTTTLSKPFPASRPALRLQSTPVLSSVRTLTSFLPSLTKTSRSSLGAATIRCRSTCSRSSRKTKHWQPANVSTPRSDMAPGCNTAPPKPPQRSRMMSRTSFSTTTSPLTFSASVRTLSTSASPCPCLFSTRTAHESCAC